MTEQTTKAGHTPGPWDIAEHNPIWIWATLSDGKRGPLASCFGGANWPIAKDAEGNDIYGNNGEPAEANARLIAAAPDLLAACEDALIATAEEGRHAECQYCDRLIGSGEAHQSYCWVPKVQAAVAKARQ